MTECCDKECEIEALRKTQSTAENCIGHQCGRVCGRTHRRAGRRFYRALGGESVCPPVETDPVTGEAKVAQVGLRRVESALLQGDKKDEVFVANPDYLEKSIGPDTKVVGIKGGGQCFVSLW